MSPDWLFGKYFILTKPMSEQIILEMKRKISSQSLPVPATHREFVRNHLFGCENSRKKPKVCVQGNGIGPSPSIALQNTCLSLQISAAQTEWFSSIQEEKWKKKPWCPAQSLSESSVIQEIWPCTSSEEKFWIMPVCSCINSLCEEVSRLDIERGSCCMYWTWLQPVWSLHGCILYHIGSHVEWFILGVCKKIDSRLIVILNVTINHILLL